MQRRQWRQRVERLQDAGIDRYRLSQPYLPGSSSRRFHGAHYRAFDQSGPRWLGISDPIAQPEGPPFISYKVARSRLDRLRFMTQDPNRTLNNQILL
jgi:hypothetical protein